jgi:hypothetical protein
MKLRDEEFIFAEEPGDAAKTKEQLLAEAKAHDAKYNKKK